MNPGPNKNTRRSIRLKDYDYSQPGAYFVTLVTIGRACVLGEIENDLVVLSSLGEMVSAVWQTLPAHFAISLGEGVVMPNHLHGIIIIGDEERAMLDIPAVGPNIPNQTGRPTGAEPGSLGAIIQNFKSITTRRANQMQGTTGKTLWQRDYYDHIIRGEKDWDAIHRYIIANPSNWEKDENR